MPAHFDDIEIGQVASLGAARHRRRRAGRLRRRLRPGLERSSAARRTPCSTRSGRGSTRWPRTDWPQTKRLGVDALRWMRNPPAGEVLRGRMTIMGKDAVGEDKGIVFAQHDLLDEAGRLVFSCLTRSVYAR